MTRKITALVLCLLLTAAVCRAARADAYETLLNQALDLCALMDACAADPQYIKLYGLDAAAQGEIQRMGTHARTALREACLYALRDGFFEAWLSASGVDCERLDGKVLGKLREGIPASLANMVNSGAPQAFLSAAAALRSGTAFPAPADNMPRYCLIHLTFMSGAEALCSFVRTENGAVSAYVTAVQQGGLHRALRQMALSGVPEIRLYEKSVLFSGPAL